MPVWLDTRGNSVLSIGVCDRCNRKFAYTDLMPDPNFPGMRVCKDDLDQYDPWRLPARQTENIALRHPRPDVSLARTNSQLLTQGNLNNYTPGNSIFIEGIPPYAGAQGDLSTNGNGFNTSGNFPVPVPPNAPVVLGFSPSSGSEDGGTVVTITGTGFSGTTVQFGSTYAEFTVINDTTIEAIAPTGIYNQSVRITVTTNAGRGVSGQMYTYTAGVPKVYSISPNTGDAAGGESVLIGGYRFTGATSVTIGGTEVPSYTIVDDSRISATTPAHAVGVVNVTVTTPTGTGTGLNLFTYGTVPVGLPTIISVSPSTGDVAGGENVTLTGTNFVNVTSVTIGGTEVDSFTVVDEEHITTVTPAHAAGSVDVTVTAEGGTGTGTNLFTYEVVPEAIYLTTGTTSWTVPIDWSNTNMIELWGGGGGGGNGGSVSSLAGSGGGGGGYARIVNTTSLTPGQVVTVAVGAGGAYGPNGITAAQPGGTTIFGSVSATGGSGGTTQYASSGGSVSGGMGIGGDVNYTGGRGGGQTFSQNTAPGGDGEGDAIGGAAGGGMGFSDPNYPNVSGGDGAGGFGGAGGARGVSESQPNGFPGQDNPKGGGGGGSLYYGTGTAGAGGYPGGGGGGTFGGVSADGADGVIKITYTRNPNAEYAPYTTNGTYVVPEGVTQVKVLTVGHGANGATDVFSSNEGGGYGGQVIEQIQNVTPGEVLTISIGAYGVNTVVTGNTWTQTAIAATAANTGGSDHGGGGAGNNGANPGSGGGFGVNGGDGGIGVLSTITGEYYGGGGGGAGASNEASATGGNGGLGGGGNGSYGYSNPPAQPGQPNTGGGGGGGYAYGIPSPSAPGGSGFVAIQPISSITLPISYLVVGAGGGGGVGNGAGGGGGSAGQLIESTTTLTSSLNTITVGTSGAGSNSPGVTGTAGGSSALNAITATGGNGGTVPGGSSTGGKGGDGAGGGGIPGNSSSPWNGGAGGVGIQSSITGTAVYYAAGGGGGATSYTVSALGGNGGGGDGACYPQVAAGNGSYYGSGGGGGAAQAPVVSGGNGYNGVVIIKYLTANAAGYTVTGGVKTTNGAYTLHTFTSSGTLTIS